MKNTIKFLLLFFLVAIPAFAQTPQPGRWIIGPAANRPTCLNGPATTSGLGNGDHYSDIDDTNDFKCMAGVWAAVGGSGGATPTSPAFSWQIANSTVTALQSVGPCGLGQVAVGTGPTSAPICAALGITDSGTSPVTTTPYPVNPDNGTGNVNAVDRGHIIRFQTGASVINLCASTTAGCAGGFVVTFYNDNAGILTVNRGGADTFTVSNGSNSASGQTSFQLSNGNYVTLSEGAGAIWEARITGYGYCQANGTNANPSVVSCGSAAAGMFSCSATASAGSCVVNTTAVTASSTVIVTTTQADGGAGQLNITCNTGNVLSTTKPLGLAKVAGTSFSINLGTVTTNPACFEFHVIN